MGSIATAMKSWLRIGLSVLGVAAAAFFAGRMITHRSTASETLIRSAAAEPWRPIAGRLTDFAHAAPPIRRSSEADLPVLHAAATAIIANPQHDAHLYAVAMLLSGKTKRAVAGLEALVAREPRAAGSWNDLAVARLADGAAADDVRSIAQALAASDRAIELRPAQPEALFNRALALSGLGLRFAEVGAWRRYLAVDSTSAWAVEARERLAAASALTRDEAWKRAEGQLELALDREDVASVQRIVSAFPLQARSVAETVHLPAWGRAQLAGNVPAVQKALNRARLIATALKKHNGDGLLERSVAMLTPDAASAFVAYGKGREDNIARLITESFDRFTEAQHGFAAAGNPMELSAIYFRANALVDLNRRPEAEAIAAQLGSRIDPAFRSLRAHWWWLQGRLATDKGRHYESLLAMRSARENFEQLGELDYAARLRIAEAGMLTRLGRDREAWQCRRLALAGAAESGRWNIIEVSIASIVREEVEGPDAEIAHSLLQVQIEAPSQLPLMRFDAILWRAFLDARSGASVLDTVPARDAAGRIPDARQRDDALDELRLFEGLTLRSSSPHSADQLLSMVIDYRTRVGLSAYLPSIHLQRARIRRAMGREADAERDLRRAIELIESLRGRIQSDPLRDAFLGRSADAYDDLSDLLLERGDWTGAFEISERDRARVLLDKAGKEPVSMAKIVAGMPGAIVGAHLTSFPSRTLLVALEHGRATHYVIDVGRSELAALRDRLRENPENEPAARRLYDLLIAPLRSRLAQQQVLVIVPDETTYGIPFAALRAPSGRFLIEETAIAIAPAGAAIGDGQQTLVSDGSRAVIVADPAFSRRSFPVLDSLPAARSDAESVRSIFKRSVALVGAQATRQAVKATVHNCDVLHIAAHAFSSSRDASLSLIALASEGGDEGLLHLEDIEALSLPRRPLVVLAGCQTASFGGGKGSLRSVAHAFLAAGSRAVLAALWDVDDEGASQLTTRFYRGIAAGITFPAALRDAQLAALRSRPPAEWAAFQIYTGIGGETD